MLKSLPGRWSMMLPASIQICPVEIPGRGRRSNEPAINDVHQLADLLASSLPLQVYQSILPYFLLTLTCQFLHNMRPLAHFCSASYCSI